MLAIMNGGIVNTIAKIKKPNSGFSGLRYFSSRRYFLSNWYNKANHGIIMMSIIKPT